MFRHGMMGILIFIEMMIYFVKSLFNIYLNDIHLLLIFYGSKAEVTKTHRLDTVDDRETRDKTMLLFR